MLHYRLRPARLLLLLLTATLACRAADRADLTLRAAAVLDLPGSSVVQQIDIHEGRVTVAADAHRTVDLGGLTVVPGFVDHHVHLLNVGMSVLNRELAGALFLELGDVRSLDELRERIVARSGERGGSEWILGKGWSQSAWGGAMPAHDAIDVGGAPVFLTRVCGHAGWANGAAMALAGIDAASSDPAGGKLLRDARGSPTGVLLERANEAVAARLPRLDDATVSAAFRAGAEALAAQGVVEAYDAGFLTPPGIVDLGADFERLTRLLAEEDRAAELPLRLNLMIPAPSAFADLVLEAPERWRQPSPAVRITHLKLFADGALGSRGAALSHAYADDPGHSGVPRMRVDEIVGLGSRALGAGLGVAIHAIGDDAVRTALDAAATLLGEQPALDPARIRIEHFSYAAAADIERAAALGVTLSVQPNFVVPADDGGSMEESRLGRIAGVYAWGTLRSAGARLAFGSDAFTIPLSPMVTVHAAATRRNAAERPADGWQPDERLSRVEAFRGAVRRFPALGGAPVEGRLRAGDRANLVVLSENPLAVADEEIRPIRVVATLRDGRVVWHDGSVAALTPRGRQP